MTTAASEGTADRRWSARKIARIASAATGAAAFVVIGVLGQSSLSDPSSETVVRAGSGDGAARDTYDQPVVKPMDLGDTATYTPPETTATTTFVSPSMKASAFGGAKTKQWS